MILKWDVLGYNIGFALQKKLKNSIYGYTNRCDDGKFIILMDYDDIPVEWIRKELRYLQQDFQLGNFYLFSSSENNTHAVCFSKVTLTELLFILRNSSIDERYIQVPYTIGKRLLTLRLSEKKGNTPKFIGVLRNKSNKVESFEHKRLINKLFNVIDECDLYNKINDVEHPTKIIISNYEV